MKQKLLLSLITLSISSASLASGVITERMLEPTLYPATELPALGASAWQASKVYLKGDTVNYQNTLYRAKWWSQNEQPGLFWTAWEAVKSSDPSWNAVLSYHTDDTVIVNGLAYQALYDNQGQHPQGSDAWQEVTLPLQQLPLKVQTTSSVYFQQGGGYPTPTPTPLPPANATDNQSSPASYYNATTFYYSTSQSLIALPYYAEQLPILRRGKMENGSFSDSGFVAPQIDGQSCSDESSCQTLLSGSHQLEYGVLGGYAKSWVEYHTPAGTTSTAQPGAQGYIELCDANYICRRYHYNY